MKLSEVHPKDKKLAKGIWIILLGTVIGFTIWLIVDQYQKLENPSTSIVMSNDVYDLPDAYLCISENNGCDIGYDVGEFCVNSTLTNFSQQAYAIHDDQYIVNATQTDDTDNFEYCIKFPLSEFDLRDGSQDNSDPIASSLTMYWFVAEEAYETYSERVKLYLVDADTKESTAAINVPYSRLDGSEDVVNMHQTDITIGRIEKDFLSGPNENVYTPLTVSTTSITQELDITLEGNSTSYVIGYVKLHITEAALSLTLIEEINPIDYYALIGNVGGLWEVILIAWGVFFVTSRREEPSLKARNFKKSYQRGKENLSAIWSSRPEEQGKTSFREHDEERPAWDNGQDVENATGNALETTASGTPDHAVHVDFEGGRGRMRPWAGAQLFSSSCRRPTLSPVSENRQHFGGRLSWEGGLRPSRDSGPRTSRETTAARTSRETTEARLSRDGTDARPRIDSLDNLAEASSKRPVQASGPLRLTSSEMLSVGFARVAPASSDACSRHGDRDSDHAWQHHSAQEE